MRRSGALRSGASRRVAFVGGACSGLLGVLLLGWLTGLRGVMHALLISLGSVAPLPFVAVLGAIALVAAVSLAVGLVAEDVAVGASGRAAIGGTLVRVYDAYIVRQRRRPLLWGLAAGLGLGVVGVWLVLAALVIPLETRTLSVLLLARARLDVGQRSGAQPTAPAAGGLLRSNAWQAGATGAAAEHVLDAFGHAIAYDSARAVGAPSYTLRSFGLDGVPSRDDLCVHGPTELTRSGEGTHDPLSFVEKLRADDLAWSAKFGALEHARCSPLE